MEHPDHNSSFQGLVVIREEGAETLSEVVGVCSETALGVKQDKCTHELMTPFPVVKLYPTLSSPRGWHVAL